jgi:hypothetical protein
MGLLALWPRDIRLQRKGLGGTGGELQPGSEIEIAFTCFQGGHIGPGGGAKALGTDRSACFRGDLERHAGTGGPSRLRTRTDKGRA